MFDLTLVSGENTSYGSFDNARDMLPTLYNCLMDESFVSATVTRKGDALPTFLQSRPAILGAIAGIEYATREKRAAMTQHMNPESRNAFGWACLAFI